MELDCAPEPGRSYEPGRPCRRDDGQPWRLQPQPPALLLLLQFWQQPRQQARSQPSRPVQRTSGRMPQRAWQADGLLVVSEACRLPHAHVPAGVARRVRRRVRCSHSGDRRHPLGHRCRSWHSCCRARHGLGLTRSMTPTRRTRATAMTMTTKNCRATTTDGRQTRQSRSMAGRTVADCGARRAVHSLPRRMSPSRWSATRQRPHLPGRDRAA